MASPKSLLFKVDCEKQIVRKELLERRNLVSPYRREEAALRAFHILSEELASFDQILSYSSFGDELDLSLFNLYLAHTGRLLLPKMEGNELRIFRVAHPESQLLENPLGIKEPSPLLCQEVSSDEISAILVPGLGFDRNHHRIGYGKGCYDRLFQKLSSHLRFGVGFREQLVEELPIVHTDISLSSLYLF